MHCRTQFPHPCGRPPLTHASARDSWTLTGKSGSVFCGVTAPFFSVLGHKVLLVPSKSVFPVLCKSGSSMVGLMVTSSKRAYVTPRSAAPIAPAPVVGHCWPGPLQETLKHSKIVLTLSLWDLLVCTRFCLSPLSVGMGFDSKCNFTPPTTLPLGVGYLYLVGSNSLLSVAVQQNYA